MLTVGLPYCNHIKGHLGVAWIMLRCPIGPLPSLVAHEGQVHNHGPSPLLPAGPKEIGRGYHRISMDCTRRKHIYTHIRPLLGTGSNIAQGGEGGLAGEFTEWPQQQCLPALIVSVVRAILLDEVLHEPVAHSEGRVLHTPLVVAL